MNPAYRKEAEVFADLAALANSPGYVHAIAQICIRDNVTFYSGKLKAADLQNLYRPERLIRTEISTLLGLLAKGQIDFTGPTADILNDYVERTDSLMSELLRAMDGPKFEAMIAAANAGCAFEDIWRGEAMREPIFYGAESAYEFQYRDLAVEKYQLDDAWLIQNKGFSISQAQIIARAMCELLYERIEAAFDAVRKTKSFPSSWLPVYQQTKREVSLRSGVSIDLVTAFFDAFTHQDNNALFQSVSDFNATNARPLIKSGTESALLFLPCSIYESLYESPFYWMVSDEPYEDTASKHRGQFTEEFAARSLSYP